MRNKIHFALEKFRTTMEIFENDKHAETTATDMRRCIKYVHIRSGSSNLTFSRVNQTHGIYRD